MGLVQVHNVTVLIRVVQAMRSGLQLPWTFEGLWGTVALFSRNAAARFQPAFILQSSVSRIEVLHNRILHNGLDKSGAVHRKSPCKGTSSGAPTPIFHSSADGRLFRGGTLKMALLPRLAPWG